jgi:hypothetical protein
MHKFGDGAAVASRERGEARLLLGRQVNFHVAQISGAGARYKGDFSAALP